MYRSIRYGTCLCVWTNFQLMIIIDFTIKINTRTKLQYKCVHTNKVLWSIFEHFIFEPQSHLNFSKFKFWQEQLCLKPYNFIHNFFIVQKNVFLHGLNFILNHTARWNTMMVNNIENFQFQKFCSFSFFWKGQKKVHRSIHFLFWLYLCELTIFICIYI